MKAETSILSDIRALPRPFWVLFAGTFINRFGGFVYPFLTLVLTGRGITPIIVGLVLAGYSAGSLVASFGGGWCADFLGRRNTIVAGAFGQAFSVIGLYSATDPMFLPVLTVLTGFFGGFYLPAASALMTDVVPQAQRLPAFALLRMASNAGFAFGTMGGGLLVAWSHFWLFAGDAITTALYGILAFVALPQGVPAKKAEARWSDAWAQLKKSRDFWVLFGAQTLVALIFAQFASTFALEVTGRGTNLAIGRWTLNATQIYALLSAWNGVIVISMEFLLTRWTRLYEPRRVMRVGYVLAGAGFFLNAFHFGIGGLWLAITLFTFGEILVLPLMHLSISRIAPAEMRGRFMGALGSSWSLAHIIGPIIALRVYHHHPALVWAGCALCGILAACLISTLGSIPGERPAAETVNS